MENIFTETMKMGAVNFAEWVGKRYPNQQLEEGKRIWRTAFLHEDFGNGKTTEELYELFIADERERLKT